MTYAWQGGSTTKWRKTRAAKLLEDPLCEDCLTRNKVTPAEEVHHPEQVSHGGDMYDWDNLVSLCTDCHKLRHGFRAKGATRTGEPTDTNHHWNIRG